MTFCPVCGAHHDPRAGCFDRTAELTRDAGMEQPESQMPAEELRKTVRQADRFMLIVLAILVGVIVLAAVLFATLR